MSEYDTKLVRTRVGGDSHALVIRETPDEPLPFGSLSGDADDVLAVTDRNPGAFLDAWCDRVGHRPRNVGVVAVGGRMRSATAERAPGQNRSPGREAAPDPRQNVVRGVADPTDAAAIRDAAAGYLDAWPDDGQTVAYVDSIGALLDPLDSAAPLDAFADFRRTLTECGAAGYFCLTRSAHDPAKVCAVKSAFDTVIECIEDVGDRDCRSHH